MFLADKWEQLKAWVLERMAPEKRRSTIMIAAGSVAVFFLVITGVSLLAKSGSGGREAPAVVQSTSARPGIIPAEDLFLPDEPDFLPGVMLEREQRLQWTAEDIAPWWQDPLKNGEEQWRNYIENTVDEILENVL